MEGMYWFELLEKSAPMHTILYKHVFRETGSMDVLYWLIGGGLFYTVGCLFFFLDKYKYMHPVWHFFVLGGSICHFISIYLLV